jgi:hypothetical protein
VKFYTLANQLDSSYDCIYLMLLNKNTGAVSHRNHPLQSVLFIVSPSMAVVSHRPPACDGTYRYGFRNHGHDNFDLYLTA